MKLIIESESFTNAIEFIGIPESVADQLIDVLQAIANGSNDIKYEWTYELKNI